MDLDEDINNQEEDDYERHTFIIDMDSDDDDKRVSFGEDKDEDWYISITNNEGESEMWIILKDNPLDIEKEVMNSDGQNSRRRRHNARS